jgi:hypothetical protein
LSAKTNTNLTIAASDGVTVYSADPAAVALVHKFVGGGTNKTITGAAEVQIKKGLETTNTNNS